MSLSNMIKQVLEDFIFFFVTVLNDLIFVQFFKYILKDFGFLVILYMIFGFCLDYRIIVGQLVFGFCYL